MILLTLTELNQPLVIRLFFGDFGPSSLRSFVALLPATLQGALGLALRALNPSVVGYWN